MTNFNEIYISIHFKGNFNVKQFLRKSSGGSLCIILSKAEKKEKIDSYVVTSKGGVILWLLILIRATKRISKSS